MCRAPLKISLLSGLPVEILQLQLHLHLPYTLIISGGENFRGFMNNHDNFILEFLSSIAIQCSTSVIRKKIYLGSCKIHKSTKIFILENISRLRRPATINMYK